MWVPLVFVLQDNNLINNIMKKLFFALFAILALVGCSDDRIDQITIDTTSANFATAGGSTTITFASSGAWTAEVVNGGANAWCSVSPASGKAGNAEICITATANDTADNRTATVVIKSGAVEQTISITQKQKDALNVSSSTFEFSAEGGEFEIEVGHNVEFDIEIDGDWITQMQPRALETSSLTFVVAENTTTQAREGFVTLTSKDDALSQVISVRQEAPRYEIIYTSSDGKIVVPNQTTAFGANIVSNVYENGRGVITFDRPVTSIGKWAFNNCSSLTSITIPNSVTSIGMRAFRGCSSLSAFYGKFASEDNRCLIVDGQLEAFAPAGLTSYGITQDVTSIGDSAFESCESLVSVTIPDSVTSICSGAFSFCSGLTGVTIPNSVTSIGEYAFYECTSLESIVLPNGITSIKDATFYVCSSLKSITIPDSVTSIEGSVFERCQSLSAFYGKFASVDNRCLVVDGQLIAFAPAGLESYTTPSGVTSIVDGVFCACESLTSITIANGVTSIGQLAFGYCKSLAYVTIAGSVTSIGANAFNTCSALTDVTIHEGVTTIGFSAFRYCTSLTSITLPKSITLIEDGAFYYCTSLASIYCKSINPPLLETEDEPYTFDYNASGRKIYVPTASLNLYKNAQFWRGYASDIVGYNF